MDLFSPAFVKSRSVRDDIDIRLKSRNRRFDVHSECNEGPGLKTIPERLHRVVPIHPISVKPQKHRPPVNDSRFRKTIQKPPNPFGSKSDFIFEKPRIENENSEPNFGSKEIGLSTLEENKHPDGSESQSKIRMKEHWETPRQEFPLNSLPSLRESTSEITIISSPEILPKRDDSAIQTHDLSAGENLTQTIPLKSEIRLDGCLSEMFCQTDVSAFNLTHNLCQTEPLFTIPRILNSSSELSVNNGKCSPSLDPILDRSCVMIDESSSTLLKHDFPMFFKREIPEIKPSQTLSFSFLQLQDETPPRGLIFLQRVFEFLTFGTYRANTMLRWYKTFNEFRESPMVTCIFNLTLWCLAFFIASFVIYIFMLIVHPILFAISSSFYSKPQREVDVEESIVAEGLLWFIEVMKAGTRALAKILSKKR